MAGDKLMQQRLKRLAEDPQAVVMQWQYATPPAECGAMYAMTLARDLLRERLQFPEDVDDDTARRILMERTKAYETFSLSHPRIFRAVTSREQGAKKLGIVSRFARMHARLETDNEITAEAPQVQAQVFREIVDITQAYGPGEATM